MELEHMNIILLNKKFLFEVGLRLLIYAQLAREISGIGSEKRIVFLSRRRICKQKSSKNNSKIENKDCEGAAVFIRSE